MLYFVFLLLHLTSSVTIDFFYSNETSPTLTKSIKSTLTEVFQDEVKIFFIELQPSDEISQMLHLPSIIIDATYSIPLRESIKRAANENEFIHIHLGDPSLSYGSWEFFTHLPTDSHYEALFSLLNFHNWELFVVIGKETSDPLASEMLNQLKDSGIKFVYFTETSQELSDFFVSRQVKPTGIQNIVIISDGDTVSLLVESLKTANAYKLGSGIIIGSKGIWGSNEDGLLILVGSGLEFSTGPEHYEALSIVKFLNSITQYPDYENPFFLRNYLEKTTKNHCFLAEFTLVNVKNGEKQVVGSIINGEIDLTGTIIYPGNSAVTPNAYTTTVSISVAYGTTNPPPYPDDLSNTVLKLGALYAAYVINANRMLGNFVFNLIYTDCGSYAYIHDFSYDCFNSMKDNLGVLFLPSS